jgi:hypothetical protein
VDFVHVPLTALVCRWVYAERVDVYTALGVGLILAGNLLNVLRSGTGGGWRGFRKGEAPGSARRGAACAG